MVEFEYKGSCFNAEEVTEALGAFFGDASNPEDQKKLCALLFLEREAEEFEESCWINIEKGRIEYRLYDDKEYTHEGSEQWRKFFDIKVITKEEYEELAKEIDPEVKRHYCLKDAWATHAEELHFLNGTLYEDYKIICKNFLSCAYLFIKIETMF